MYLVVDAGNSRIKAGLYEAGELAEFKVFKDFKEFRAWARRVRWERGAYASVVPSLFSPLNKLGLVPLTWENWGMRTRYSEPWRLGPDRMANALYLKFFAGKPGAIIDFGTAITVDFVEGDEHLGGAIMPGSYLALKALVAGTAAVRPRSSQLASPPLIGRSTEECLASGLVWGLALGAASVASAGAEELGWEDWELVVTGGWARSVHRLVGGELVPAAALLGLGRWLDEGGGLR